MCGTTSSSADGRRRNAEKKCSLDLVVVAHWLEHLSSANRSTRASEGREGEAARFTSLGEHVEEKVTTNVPFCLDDFRREDKRTVCNKARITCSYQSNGGNHSLGLTSTCVTVHVWAKISRRFLHSIDRSLARSSPFNINTEMIQQHSARVRKQHIARPTHFLPPSLLVRLSLLRPSHHGWRCRLEKCLILALSDTHTRTRKGEEEEEADEPEKGNNCNLLANRKLIIC